MRVQGTVLSKREKDGKIYVTILLADGATWSIMYDKLGPNPAGQVIDIKRADGSSPQSEAEIVAEGLNEKN